MSGFMQLILPDYTKEVPQAKCCIACLNKNVISIDLNTCKHAAIFEYLLDYKPNLKEAIVCLNCHSLIKKIEKFRVELTENIKLFEESQTNILNVNRSGLGYSKIEIYSTIDSQPIEMEIKSTNQVPPIEIMTEVKIEYDSSNSEHVPLVEIQKRKPVKKSQNIKKDKKELKNKPVKRNVSSLQKQYEGKIRIVVLSEDEMLEERQVEAKKPSYLRLPYKCDLCITAFDHELTLKSHIESRHNKSGEYECCVCKSHLSTKISFDEHYKRHFRRYECIECGKRTNNLYPLLKHYNDNHGLIQLEFSCKTCDYKTDKYRVFRYHLEKHRQSNVECDLCGKTFVNNNGLKTHLYTVHGQSSRVYGCDKCNKVYKAKSGLSAHIATHSSPVYCRDCDTHFRTPHGLRHHLKTHSRHVEDNDKRFVCKDCDLKFLTPKSLREHVDWVHLNDTKYECDSCSKVFKNKNSLKKHFQYVHEKKRPPRNKICDHCGRAFTTLQILRSHIHTHTGERPHRCDVCGASFAHKGALYTHNKLLHNKQ